MTDKTVVPEEAVVAAANELHDREGYSTSLADAPAYRKAYFREIARQTLEAATPFIAAKALEDAADGWQSYIRAMNWGTTAPIAWLRARAAAVRGEG